MAIFVERPASPVLWNYCRRVQENIRPGSRVQNALYKDLRTLAVDDHTDMLLRGVDRYGRPRAPLAKSTLANRKRGPGPSLVPRGLLSRFVTKFEAVWETDPGQGLAFLVCRYRDFVSKKGFPIPVAHMTGARKPGTNWVLPKRDTGGITPKGWAAIRARFARLPDDIRRMGG